MASCWRCSARAAARSTARSSRAAGALPFLTSPSYFRSLLVGSDIWQNLGWGAIIYLAAIAGIDPTLYEAARVDGASRLRLIWHITLLPQAKKLYSNTFLTPENLQSHKIGKEQPNEHDDPYRSRQR
jgi:ABC-type sugar transport system permease subunit